MFVMFSYHDDGNMLMLIVFQHKITSLEKKVVIKIKFEFL